MPSYKEEEYEDASPKAQLPIPEELPPPPPEPAVVEPVGDLLVVFMLKYICCVGSCSESPRIISSNLRILLNLIFWVKCRIASSLSG